jgi:predicted TIM-barrel fold metal-dependent hydrolase
MAPPSLIDVHHHFLPPDYVAALDRSGNNPPDGNASLPPWSEELAIGFLDAAGIATAFLSISSPGLVLDGHLATDLARMTNEYAAGLIASHPGRFGGFASLPLPEVDSSLAEIAHAFDHLHLDGVALLTNHDHRYLGDPAFDPVFDELNRRQATVFLHPTSPACCGQTGLGLPSPVIEFMFETTRAVTNLIFSGTIDRCPDISWIIPHAGAALPMLATRIAMAPLMAPDRCRATETVAQYLDHLHYDLAGPHSDGELRALLAIADPSRLLYGSDWPFTPELGVKRLLDSLRATQALDGAQLDSVLDGANARRLLERAARPAT